MERPSLSIDLKVNGEIKTITMSYGLFNEVMKAVGEPDKIQDLLVTDPYLRDYVIRRMLTGNKKVREDEDLVDPFDLDLDVRDLDDLLAWVGDHILYFFITSAAKTAKLGEKYQETIQQLSQSKIGSAD